VAEGKEEIPMGSLEEDSEYISIHDMQNDRPAGKAFKVDKHIKDM
jgi:hypothetical protein